MANKAYVVEENISVRADLNLLIGDIVFVGLEPAPEKSGLQVLSPEEFRHVPLGYLKPAVDSQVQTAARDRATAVVEKARAAMQAAEDSLAATKANRADEIERLNSEVNDAKYRASIAADELERAEAEYEAKLKVFGPVLAVSNDDVFVALGLTERQAGLLTKAGYTTLERARLLGDNDLLSLGLSNAAIAKLRAEDGDEEDDEDE